MFTKIEVQRIKIKKDFKLNIYKMDSTESIEQLLEYDK